jgi:iduronate 2-sulfatase
VGRVLDALDRLKLSDITIVVFMSDHGYFLGERGQWMKQALFERSVRTPLIVAGPGVTAKNGSSSRVVEFLDIYPTLADLARVAPPSGLHGRSLTPLLRNPETEWPHAALTQTRRFLNPAQNPNVAGVPANATFMGYSVRTEKWRYTEWDEGKRGVELYDEAADPDEMRNLAADPKHSATVVEMKKLLRSMRGIRD